MLHCISLNDGMNMKKIRVIKKVLISFLLWRYEDEISCDVVSMF
jgi:hypothetical protein